MMRCLHEWETTRDSLSQDNYVSAHLTLGRYAEALAASGQLLRLSSRILWIAPVAVVRIRAEIKIDDIADALHVHHLPHRLPIRGYRHHVIARLNEVPGAPATKETSPATLACSAGRSFCRP
jgi:hypothetical protein